MTDWLAAGKHVLLTYGTERDGYRCTVVSIHNDTVLVRLEEAALAVDWPVGCLPLTQSEAALPMVSLAASGECEHHGSQRLAVRTWDAEEMRAAVTGTVRQC